ncbi:MAG TPA: phosphatase PAP2 family protein [Actinophytocola sp.]|uniref:phosphatase PAP2 family protein n=1 Tax=Actinophytocola sp. TaxID=1872138 RepID=UPI002DB67610|nr:phosphatase PAP2 family protein [Actinophytocola sp.]HEU5469739.1 phosphatase PAP2 family protein [Actinophytocola sp.]
MAAIAALLVTALGILYAAGGGLGPWDNHAMPLTGFTPPWRTFALIVDFLGEPVGVLLIVAATVTAALLLHHPRAAVLVVLAVGLGGTITTLLKPVVDRHIHGDWLAYPSGHTATLTTFGFVTGLLIADRLHLTPRRATLTILTLATLTGAAMSYSQTMLSAHYLTDTIGGYLVALTVVPVTALLIDHLANRINATRQDHAVSREK